MRGRELRGAGCGAAEGALAMSGQCHAPAHCNEETNATTFVDEVHRYDAWVYGVCHNVYVIFC